MGIFHALIQTFLERPLPGRHSTTRNPGNVEESTGRQGSKERPGPFLLLYFFYLNVVLGVELNASGLVGKFFSTKPYFEPSLTCVFNFITVTAERTEFIPWLGSGCFEVSLLVNSYFIFILCFLLE